MPSPVNFLLERFAAHPADDAMVWRDQRFTYGWLHDRIRFWQTRLAAELAPGTVTALETDFSPDAAALLLALAGQGAIIVPLTGIAAAKRDEYLATAEVELDLRLTAAGGLETERLPRRAAHGLYAELRNTGHPGLVLFSSGSTGRSKGAVHDFSRMLERFHEPPRHRFRAIAFLLFDHIGGINTLLHTFAGGGCLIAVSRRDPDHVLEQVAKHQADLLPTSPTFINLILLSGAHERHDLLSLKVVSYGTEPMPESTLRRFHALFPDIRLRQTYGLSETGILPVKSKSSDSLWIKAGGEGCRIRVTDAGLLEVKSDTAMLGYLNAPSPFTADGWFMTGDSVETDGEFIRILGRQSELINVGGEKVYPAEVESVLLNLDNVAEAAVYGEKNPLTGAIVCARVRLRLPEARATFVRRMREFCAERLRPYQIPVRVSLVDAPLHGDRFKTFHGPRAE